MSRKENRLKRGEKNNHLTSKLTTSQHNDSLLKRFHPDGRIVPANDMVPELTYRYSSRTFTNYEQYAYTYGRPFFPPLFLFSPHPSRTYIFFPYKDQWTQNEPQLSLKFLGEIEPHCPSKIITMKGIPLLDCPYEIDLMDDGSWRICPNRIVLIGKVYSYSIPNCLALNLAKNESPFSFDISLTLNPQLCIRANPTG